MRVIDFACTEERFKGVIAWNEKPCKVYEELASNIEEDQEKVDSDEAEEGIDLRYRGLLFEVVEHWILG